MSKFYEVDMTAHRMFFVEVEDNEGEEDALEHSRNEFAYDEATAVEITEEHFENYAHHANEVLRIK